MTRPDPEPWLAEARRHEAAGDPASAFAAYRACAAERPDCASAWLGGARLLVARGDRGAATQLLRRAIANTTEDGEGRRQVASAFAALLAGFSGRTWHARLEQDVLACLAVPNIDHQVLARLAAELLMAREPEPEPEPEPVLERIAADPLWRAFLSRCLNVDALMEGRIADLRVRLVARQRGQGLSPDLFPLACGLALQAFAGEYLDTPDLETPDNGETGAFDAVLAAAQYRPLIAVEDRLTPAILDHLAAVPHGLGALLVQRTLTDPRRERVLAENLPAVRSSEVEDAVSAAVRRQYEASPYPRWTAPPASPPRRLADVVAGLPGVAAPTQVDRVLIAGSGTGYEALDLAQMDPGLSIVALDLSRASLAYGARKAQDWGIKTLAFVQGDILDLEQMTREGGGFDLAVSTGVLHHMDDPAAGLAAIIRAIRPGGLIRLALYSESARAPVRAAHALIREQGLTASPDDIRAFRRQVLAVGEGSALAALRTSDDFYSLSGCRDLLFHVHEHHFTLPRVADLLAGQGLRLVGFDVPPEGARLFREMHGAGADALDLTLWDAVEARAPTLFAGMYQMWGRKA